MTIGASLLLIAFGAAVLFYPVRTMVTVLGLVTVAAAGLWLIGAGDSPQRLSQRDIVIQTHCKAQHDALLTAPRSNDLGEAIVYVDARIALNACIDRYIRR